ncbi:hypothetical protein HK096_007139 [Nowakowskiella sp. JEL0078]|nr:hypothetical protein HK096_007139 [Nowakowskiella sp. JEL0078]
MSNHSANSQIQLIVTEPTNRQLYAFSKRTRAETTAILRISCSASASGPSISTLPQSHCLVWFRNDLRLTHNRALSAAIAAATASSSLVVALYIFSPLDLKRHDVGPVKVDFIARTLRVLARDLWESYSIPLLLRIADNGDDQIIDIVANVCKQFGMSDVFLNNEHELDEAQRDWHCVKRLDSWLRFHRFLDQCVVAPGTIKSASSNSAYLVYTPYKNSWLQLIKRFVVDPEKIFKIRELWPAGENFAKERLENFAIDKKRIQSETDSTFTIGYLNAYKEKRDIPSLDHGTSRLSPYLAIGSITAAQCVARAMEIGNWKLTNIGILTWIQEFIWRDFYRQILVAHPRVNMYKPFKLNTTNVQWCGDQKLFDAWCQGKTGYPIVDAGMRQMQQTGWMHNRVRMITASFLTKHLLHNWQLGERWFAMNLIDYDFSSNNGGWQWSASTGTDSQPYFRIFNPVSDVSENFDPDGIYIRKYVKELEGMKSKDIHNPQEALCKSDFKKLGYPERIVDHKISRENAINAFKILKLGDETIAKNDSKKGKKENRTIKKRKLK